MQLNVAQIVRFKLCNATIEIKSAFHFHGCLNYNALYIHPIFLKTYRAHENPQEHFSRNLDCRTGVIFCVLQASEGKLEASAKCETRTAGGPSHRACPALCARLALALARLKNAKK